MSNVMFFAGLPTFKMENPNYYPDQINTHEPDRDQRYPMEPPPPYPGPGPGCPPGYYYPQGVMEPETATLVAGESQPQYYPYSNPQPTASRMRTVTTVSMMIPSNRPPPRSTCGGRGARLAMMLITSLFVTIVTIVAVIVVMYL